MSCSSVLLSECSGSYLGSLEDGTVDEEDAAVEVPGEAAEVSGEGASFVPALPSISASASLGGIAMLDARVESPLAVLGVVGAIRSLRLPSLV